MVWILLYQGEWVITIHENYEYSVLCVYCIIMLHPYNDTDVKYSHCMNRFHKMSNIIEYQLLN